MLHRIGLGVLAALLLLGVGVAHTSAQTAARLPITLSDHWADYRSTEMDIDYTGIAFLSNHIHTGPAEFALARFTPTVTANQVQAEVLYDTGLIWSGSPFGTIQPFFAVGDTLTGVLIPDTDELVLTDNMSGQVFTLCGQNAPRPASGPSFADTKPCGTSS